MHCALEVGMSNTDSVQSHFLQCKEFNSLGDLARAWCRLGKCSTTELYLETCYCLHGPSIRGSDYLKKESKLICRIALLVIVIQILLSYHGSCKSQLW